MPEPVQTDKEQKRLIRMAETISKALPFMRRHNDATFVVKYGGHAMTDPKLGDLVARDVVLMKQVGMNPIVVHGGGPQINKMLERVGIKSTFVNGLRVTDAPTMEIDPQLAFGDRAPGALFEARCERRILERIGAGLVHGVYFGPGRHGITRSPSRSSLRGRHGWTDPACVSHRPHPGEGSIFPENH